MDNRASPGHPRLMERLDPCQLHARAVDLFQERYQPGRTAGELSRLGDLVARFAHLPYENISKIIHLEASGPIPRDPLTVMTDHLELGTGGTCFSLTALLAELCRSEGFACFPVMAHMRHGQNIHCALRVQAAGRPFLVDPGYLLARPLAIGGEGAASSDGQPILVPAGSLAGTPPGLPAGDFDLFTQEPEGPRWRYRFSDRSVAPEQFFAHWRESFGQSGMRSLLASRRGDQGEVLFLHNHKLRSSLGPRRSTRNVRQQLEQAVQETFGIHPLVTGRAWSLLERVRADRRRGP